MSRQQPLDPREITDYYRSRDQLEEFILLCVFVCGKRAMQQAEKLHGVLSHRRPRESPFQFLRRINGQRRRNLLEQYKVGQYARIDRSIAGLTSLRKSLEIVTEEQLVAIHGISYKTANFFLLHSREGYNRPCIDTHNLHYMRDVGYSGIPKTSPSCKRKYDSLCGIYLELRQEYEPKLSLAEFDLLVWRYYSGNMLEEDDEDAIRDRLGLQNRLAAG